MTYIANSKRERTLRHLAAMKKTSLKGEADICGVTAEDFGPSHAPAQLATPRGRPVLNCCGNCAALRQCVVSFLEELDLLWQQSRVTPSNNSLPFAVFARNSFGSVRSQRDEAISSHGNMQHDAEQALKQQAAQIDRNRSNSIGFSLTSYQSMTAMDLSRPNDSLDDAPPMVVSPSNIQQHTAAALLALVNNGIGEIGEVDSTPPPPSVQPENPLAMVSSTAAKIAAGTHTTVLDSPKPNKLEVIVAAFRTKVSAMLLSSPIASCDTKCKQSDSPLTKSPGISFHSQRNRQGTFAPYSLPPAAHTLRRGASERSHSVVSIVSAPPAATPTSPHETAPHALLSLPSFFEAYGTKPVPQSAALPAAPAMSELAEMPSVVGAVDSTPLHCELPPTAPSGYRTSNNSGAALRQHFFGPGEAGQSTAEFRPLQSVTSDFLRNTSFGFRMDTGHDISLGTTNHSVASMPLASPAASGALADRVFLLDSHSSSGTHGSTVRVTEKVTKGEDELGMKVLNDYLMMDMLGRGACGKVKLAFSTERNNMVAIKIVKRALGSGGGGEEADGLNPLGRRRSGKAKHDSVIQEIAVMKKLRHKNIVSLYEVIDDPEAAKLYLVMQYVDRGCVGNVRDDGTCERVPCDKLIGIARQAAAGLEYLHSHGVLHHDIKPENILIDSDDRVYLSDFGVSLLMDETTRTFGQRRGGTPLFMPPEMHQYNDNNEQHANVFARRPSSWDIWSLGVTLLTLLIGKVPFESIDEIVSFGRSQEMLSSPEIMAKVSAATTTLRWETLLKCMLHPDPAMRPSARVVKEYIKNKMMRHRSGNKTQKSFVNETVGGKQHDLAVQNEKYQQAHDVLNVTSGQTNTNSSLMELEAILDTRRGGPGGSNSKRRVVGNHNLVALTSMPSGHQYSSSDKFGLIRNSGGTSMEGKPFEGVSPFVVASPIADSEGNRCDEIEGDDDDEGFGASEVPVSSIEMCNALTMVRRKSAALK